MKNQKKILLIFLLSLIYSEKVISYKPNDKCWYEVYLSAYNKYLRLSNNVSYHILNYEGTLIKTITKSCKGTFDFYELQLIGRDTIIVKSGSYIEAQDLTVKPITVINPQFIDMIRIDTSYTYKPFKNGKWVYYDTTGKAIKEEVWNIDTLKMTIIPNSPILQKTSND